MPDWSGDWSPGQGSGAGAAGGAGGAGGADGGGPGLVRPGAVFRGGGTDWWMTVYSQL